MRKVLFLLCVVALLATAALADDWAQGFNVSGTPDVRLRVNDGAIRVHSGADGKVEASIRAAGYTRGRDYEVQVSQSGSRIDLNIRRRTDFRWFNWGAGPQRSFEVDLVVPRAANLDLNSGDGSVKVDDVAGNLRVGTGDGSIEVSRVKGNIELRTGDGHVTADAEGSLQAHTGDGAVTARGRFQALTLETGDGHLDVRVDEGSTMQRGWSIRTGDGGVTLSLPASFAADLDVATQDGHIDSDFSGNSQNHNRFQSRLNNGTHLLTVRTGDGGIRIRRM